MMELDLRKMEQFEIENAVIHVLDKAADEPVINSITMDLKQNGLEFLGTHISKLAADDANVKAKLFNERGVIYNAAMAIMSDEDFIAESKKIAYYIFKIIKQYSAVPSCDLVIAQITTDGIPAVVILKLDYQKSVEHEIDFKNEGFTIDLNFFEKTLPMPKQKLSCGAIIKMPSAEANHDLVAVERIVKGEDGEPLEFFIREVLQANRIVDELDKTKMFHKQMEEWVRKNVKNQMDKAIGIREDLSELYEHQVELSIQEVANDLIDDQEQREKFVAKLELVGFDCEEAFELDKQFLEKKLQSRNIKTDSGFSIKGAADLFKDPSKFEVKYNGDGTVNYIIKNVRNISEK